MSSQLICKGCPHRSEKDEQFYTISLDIKNKRDILEALQLYVRGDMLEGDNAYFCEICKKHVDTLKRSCAKVCVCVRARATLVSYSPLLHPLRSYPAH